MSGSKERCGYRGVNDPVTSEGVELKVDSASLCILGVISEKACSTTLSLSVDSINNVLFILSKGLGKGYLVSKSTLELSSDPTAEGRLVSLDKGSPCRACGPASC